MERNSKSNILIQTLLLGSISILLYVLLYHFEHPILEFSKQGGWYFLIPISIAIVFSIVHGAFTDHFWDLLGIKAKSVKK